MITSVHIRGFRCCADALFEPEPLITALVGKNGAGKTTILRAIEWLSDAFAKPEVDVWASWLDWPSITIQLLIEEWNYEYTFAYESQVIAEALRLHDAQGGARTIFRREGEELELTSPHRQVRMATNVLGLPFLYAVLPKLDDDLHHIRRLRDFFRSVQYYSFDSAQPLADGLIRQSVYENWSQAFEAEQRLTDSVLMRIAYMQERQPELLQELKQLVGIHGLALLDGIKVDKPPLENDRDSYFLWGAFSPATGVGGAGRHCSFSDLSAGTRRVLSILVSVLFDKRSVMLLEQPEDSIHPGLLRKLLDILRSYSHRTQLIFSTHSPAVLDLLRPEEVRLVTAPDGKTTIRRLSNHEVESAKQFLKDEGAFSEFCETLDET